MWVTLDQSTDRRESADNLNLVGKGRNELLSMFARFAKSLQKSTQKTSKT